MDKSQIESTINGIRKRSGAVTAFNQDKISNAIFRVLAATSKADRALADQLANKVMQKLVEQGFTSYRITNIENITESILIDYENINLQRRIMFTDNFQILFKSDN